MLTLRIALLTALTLLAPGYASAISLESLVMPGPVIEGHADVEDNCRACHDPFDSEAQPALCLECHEGVAQDIANGTGFHGRSPQAGSAPCKSCHTEHEGRAADITGLQPELFDHAKTDFALAGAHANLICAACHEGGARHAATPTACSSCHDDDPHAGRLGHDCASCHESSSWDQATFDHGGTEFPLTGAHERLNCGSCHTDARFESVGRQCIACHAGDDVHAGARGTDCASCHTTTDWNAQFDHRAVTGFALDGAHAGLQCGNCHVAEPDYQGLETGCSACHSGDDVHRGRNGADCSACHGESTWEVRFDHAAETGFELRGSHAPLACASCHTASLSDPLPSDCGGCHAADNPHGEALSACANCHTESAWAEAPGFHHDRADFALVGMHRNATCEQCHESLVFAPASGECRDCHADAEPHGSAFGTACESCHNPVGWNYAQFNHARETDFGLSGAHADLACESCHAPGADASELDTTCIGCHRADDVHRGAFGQTCDRCHDQGSFENPVVPNGGTTWPR